MRRSFLQVAAVAVLGLALAARAEQVANPAYETWAKYKPGTSITQKQVGTMSMMPTMPTETTLAQKLVEVTPAAATVEITTTISVMGQTSETKSTNKIPAKVEKGQEYAPAGMSDMKVEIKDMKEGKETLEVKGAKVETVTREYTVVMTPAATTTAPSTNPAMMFMEGGSTIKSKTWTAAEIPGGTVKSEQDMTMGQMGTMKTTMTLVDYTIVK